MISQPLYQNPLGGGASQIIDPSVITPRGGAEMSDPIMQGFQNSEFRKNANMMQQDAVNFKYKGRDMMMNSSMAGAFKQYLDSIGKGDLYEGTLGLTPLPQPTEGVSQDVLGNPNLLAPLNPVPSHQQATPPILDGTPSVNPIVSGDNSIASTVTVNPFQEQLTGFGDQLTGFGDQFSGLNDRLNKIEEGIASLLGNRGQGLNMGYQPYQPSSNFNYMGIPSVFSPYGGMFG
jgi:hypothetical protein